MKFDPQKHHRKSIRLKGYDYSWGGSYYVTSCIKERECLLGDIQNEEMILNEFGNIVQAEWDVLPNHYPNIELDEFQIMPNHFHGIIIINDTMINPNQNNLSFAQELLLQTTPNNIKQKHLIKSTEHTKWRFDRRQMLLPKIIGRLKMRSAKEINLKRDTPGTPVWQRDYYEHVIRNQQALNNIRNYIKNNPINWNADPENPVVVKTGKDKFLPG